MIIVFWIGVVLILLYEIVELYAHRGYTISEVIWHLCSKHPLVPFAFGVLMGHLFWQAVY
jgi:hypothetical protein